MDAGPSKRAYGSEPLQGPDEAKRPRLIPSSDTPPTSPMTAHGVNPSPHGGVSEADIARGLQEQMQLIQQHEELCIQWAAATGRVRHDPVDSPPRHASGGGNLPSVHLGHPPLINLQMGRICERMMMERQNRSRDRVDHPYSA
ncbi:hypothetical protein HPB49_000608 [Dermacentor silvarum]|uniref:Uncharacterized protein n=1 Tax=Dermacentor silvarum TaxID=543639 RepID=A0ACB8DSK9_DERSI|nr:uncharacterized protein LOC125942307 [Dermacentor silvarum]KAH7977316.1 hypothetical protein HPB49_000608 [Dermacentor silvarum]